MECEACGEAIRDKAICMRCLESEESDRREVESDAVRFYSLLSDLWAGHYRDGDNYGIRSISPDLAARIQDELGEFWEP